MRVKKTYFKAVFFGLILLSPALSFAASFPCGESNMCAPQTFIKSIKPQQNVVPVPEKTPAPAKKIDSVAFFMQNLNLTEAQNAALYQVTQSQIPEVLKSMRNLEDAHVTLRNMALNNQYDQKIADALVQTIANHTANLALLQAQREYEIFAMLNIDQVKRYYELVAQTQQ